MVAAQRLVHLELGSLYTQPTALVAFPGAALILVPVVAFADMAGLGLAFQTAQNPYPDLWLAAGPYEIMLSSVVLIAADSIAERMAAAGLQRALLAVAGAAALWNVSVRWGHPEDAVALALLLFSVGALLDARPVRAGWLMGAAIAVQPLVLLGLPMVLLALPPRRVAGFLIRAALPATVLLGLAGVANTQATVGAVTRQPNWPMHNHPTPWTALAPQMGGGAVAAGPARVLAVLSACACALIIERRRRGRGRGHAWRPPGVATLMWWLAVALAFRCVFEPVMVAYYLWPVLSVALIAASTDRSRLKATAVTTTALTFASQVTWQNPWGWWGVMVVAGLALTLWASRPVSSAGLDTPMSQ